MRPFTPLEIQELLRGVRVSVPEKNAAALFSHAPKRPLRIKYGIDPTQPQLHLGYFAILRKLRILQEHGHVVVLLLGDFTARFGDPTDKMKPRTFRDKSDVQKSMRTYVSQAATVLDVKKTELRHNSEWYERMSAEDLLRLLSGFTVQQLLERDMFSKRQRQGIPIWLHEPTYPVLQGYDSAILKSDATVIGKDQLFNEMVGRRIQEGMQQKPQVIFGVELLVGTDGKEKMSQSHGNHIPLVASAKEQYGKLMSIPDDAVLAYAELLTDMPLDPLREDVRKGGIAARDAKASVARSIVQQLHGEKEAQQAENAYIEVFREKSPPKDMPVYTVAEGATMSGVLRDIGIVASNSQARQLAVQKGIRLDGRIIDDPGRVLNIAKKEAVLSVGKRTFIRLVRKQPK